MEKPETAGEMEDVSDQRPGEVVDGLATRGEMDRKRWEGHHSICQTLRDIYHLTDNPDVRLKCRLAVAMAKAMNEKLKWYKAKQDAVDSTANAVINSASEK
jgi:hypothetical protein